MKAFAAEIGFPGCPNKAETFKAPLAVCWLQLYICSRPVQGRGSPSTPILNPNKQTDRPKPASFPSTYSELRRKETSPLQPRALAWCKIDSQSMFLEPLDKSGGGHLLQGAGAHHYEMAPRPWLVCNTCFWGGRWQVGPRLVGRMDDVREKETGLLMLPALAEFFKQGTPKTLLVSSEDGWGPCPC